MPKHPVEMLIEKADQAINQEDFATLTGIYAEDAVLVVQPGQNAVGREQIDRAFQAIAAHFNHTLRVKEAGMKILESGDTALVLAKTLVSAEGYNTMERKATYVFKKSRKGNWRCAIDNSYGHDLLDECK